MKPTKKTNQTKLVKELDANRATNLSEMAESLGDVMRKQTIQYVRHSVDPKNEPFAPRPTKAAGYSGHVSGRRMYARTTLYVGTTGYGFAIIDPIDCAGCTDRPLLAVSLTSNGGIGSSLIPGSAVASQSSVVYPTGNDLPSAVGLGTNNAAGDFYATCVNTCAAYIKPIGSAVNQDGMMYILENPNHPSLIGVPKASEMTIDQVISHPRTRSIPGNQVGTPGFLNCLNFHPQNANADSQHFDDDDYLAPTSATTQLGRGCMYIVVTGTPSSAYELEIYGSWLAKGLNVSPNIPNYSDVLGMEVFYNLLLHKRTSGWVGNGADVVGAYLIALRKVHLDGLPHNELLAAKSSSQKAKEAGKSHWYDTLTKVWSYAKPFVRDVAGIALAL